jgi:hypothetical protein
VTHYTIHYRCDIREGWTALIVADGCGNAFLFSGGQLQARLSGSGACARLASVLGRSGACAPVRATAPYTLDGLRHLTAPAAREAQAARQAVVAQEGATR